MTILLTGGAGNLGSRLLVPLIQRGDRVVLFDLPRKPFFGSDEFHQCLFLHGDVCDRDAVQRAVRDHRVDSLFHLGAILSTQAEADPDLAWRVNMDGMRNVLEAARIEGVAKVILASTLATYGPGLASPLQIDAPMWPASLYGVTKVAGECLGSYYHQRFGLDFRAIRFPSIVASRGGAAGAAGRFTAEVFSEAVAHGAYEFYLPPDASIPIIYIEDAIKALVAFHDAPPDRLKRRSYNIHACGVTARELEEVVKARLPQVVITYNPDPVQTAIVDSWPHVLDDSDAREDWGWRETYDLDRMADEVISILQREKNDRNLPKHS